MALIFFNLHFHHSCTIIGEEFKRLASEDWVYGSLLGRAGVGAVGVQFLTREQELNLCPSSIFRQVEWAIY
jgi:hypothetical protein